MNRIGSFSQSQALTADLMRLNQQQFKTQAQISSGKVATRFADLPQETSVLLSARGVEAKLAQYTTAAEEARTRLNLQDIHLEGLAQAGTDLREAVTTAVAADNGVVLMDTLDRVFETAASLLNSQYNGQYIYGGTQTDRPPVASGDLSDLVAATDAADLFVNNDLKPSVTVDDNLTVEYGVLADEVGGGLFTALKRIADYNAGPNGPIGETLTPEQKDFLQGEIAGLRSTVEAINADVARNGLNHRDVDRAISRHEAGDVFIKGFISDIEDVDLAEAITRLNNDRVAVEASTRVLADLNRVSLLDFI
ncbi:MAG: flagellin [Alphaproteobacteria bacterium]